MSYLQNNSNKKAYHPKIATKNIKKIIEERKEKDGLNMKCYFTGIVIFLERVYTVFRNTIVYAGAIVMYNVYSRN